MTLPRISLVTCSYQQGPYLESTLKSVLDQRYENLEYIVIDGGSQDDSRDIIESHAHELAYWVSEPDRGQTDALIKGFKRASGDVLGWLCSDDLLLPGALQAVGEFFAKHPDVQAVYGDSLWIDSEGRFLRPKKEMPFNRFVFLYDHNYIPQPSMFWRRSLYDISGGLNERFNLAMDNDLWERFSAHADIGYIPRYLSCMRYYPEQKTRRLKPQGKQEDAIIRHRRSPHGQTQPVYPLLHLMARATRIATKALTGGYGARVPEEHLRWLRHHEKGA
ncbi:MAG TPA: glycosyltransferase family 2 protein [Burkholderiales bacterium]|jgi:glycosyltransferase involved in cell wall biosynthesis|nr:glycosyltransferase family 2 protein [Burkholderiales bacterium]